MGLTRVVTDQATYTVHHGLTGSPLKVFQCQTGLVRVYCTREGLVPLWIGLSILQIPYFVLLSLDRIVDSSDCLFCYFCTKPAVVLM